MNYISNIYDTYIKLKEIDDKNLKKIEMETDNIVKNVEKEYDIIDEINYYTFIDYVKDINKKINNFFYKSKKYERLIYYDFKNWLKFLEDTYKDKKDKHKLIWIQFEKDANRSKIIINRKHLYNNKNILNYLKLFKENIRIYILIILTQVIFVIPYTLIQNNIKQYDYILSELSCNDLKNNKDINKFSTFTCEFNKNKSIIKIIKYLRIFKLTQYNDITISIVKLFIEFNLIKNKYSIFKISFIPIDI